MREIYGEIKILTKVYTSRIYFRIYNVMEDLPYIDNKEKGN